MALLLLPLLFLVLTVPAATAASGNIRVAVGEELQAVRLSSPAGLMVAGEPGRRAEPSLTLTPDSLGTRTLRVVSGDGIVRVDGRPYRGAVEVSRNSAGLLLVVNDLDVEDYLLGVVPREVPPSWEPEALKAQAVASRTFALYRKERAGGKPFHLRASVLDQLYGGREAEQESTTRAVRETRGRVVVYQGKLIPAFYHSSCGGHTEDAAELWDIDAPYLRGVDCDCQEISKYGVWEERLTIASIAFALDKIGFRVNDISGVAIHGITRAGRVKNLLFRHEGGSAVVKAESLRAALGYSQIPSVFFETSLAGQEIIFSGRGMGHGVGLCQWGARLMAQQGSRYQEILAYYYPGTAVADASSAR